MPYLVHRVRSFVKDLVTPIHFGSTLPDMLDDPVGYYSVKRYDNPEEARPPWVVMNIHFFHRYDWSDSWLSFIRRADSHPFDFEGVTIFATILAPGAPLMPKLVVCQAHTALVAYSPCGPVEVTIESRGHPIRCHAGRPEADWEVNYGRRYRLIDLEDRRFRADFSKHIEPVFSRYGVHAPWEVNDHRIRRKFGKKTNGSIYTDPLLEWLPLAKEAGLDIPAIPFLSSEH